MMKKFVGEIAQVPPKFSAVKIKGKKSYERARKGETILLQPRAVTIFTFDLLDFKKKTPLFSLRARIVCSSGTYVRALARDLGEALGIGGYVEKLFRTKIGTYNVKQAKKLSDLTQKNWMRYLLRKEVA